MNVNYNTGFVKASIVTILTLRAFPLPFSLLLAAACVLAF